MSSLETAAAVAAVMSAFFTGSEMAKQIMKWNRKPKGEKAIKEKMLQESLLAGEHQIGQMFSDGYEQTGRRFRVGDDTATERLLDILATIQTDIIRSLQIALQHEKAELDVTKLQEFAILFRRDATNTLEQLLQRISESATEDSPDPSPTEHSHGRYSVDSVRSFMTTYGSMSSQFIPSA
ncbi:hypothetical protein LTS18_001419, partial [Coniosporium uncinatum]